MPRGQSYGPCMCVLNNMAEARAPSTRRLYALKWSIFSAWCQVRDLDQVTSDVSVILSFLQEMLDKQRYTAAIAAFHAPIAGRSVDRDNSFFNRCQENESSTSLYSSILGLTNRTKGPEGAPIWTLQSSSLRALSLKTALLLALASIKTCSSPSTLLAWNSGLTTPKSSWNKGWVMYLRCSPLRSEPSL